MNRHRIVLAGFAIFALLWGFAAFVVRALAATFGGH